MCSNQFKSVYDVTIRCVMFMLIFITALNQGHEIPNALKMQAKKLHEMCQKQINVDKKILEQSTTGDLSEDATFKCYLHCLFDKVGLIDDQNVIHLEHLNEVLPEDLHAIINGLVLKCGTKPGNNGCEVAFNTVKCYKEADPVLFAEISSVVI